MEKESTSYLSLLQQPTITGSIFLTSWITIVYKATNCYLLLRISKKIFVACFQALGILGKLITGSFLCLVEEPNAHIFSLNDTWLHVITKLESFATDAHPLMEGMDIVPNGRVTKDEIYEELMKENEELDELTEECLRVLCCSCVTLLKQQLKDQLPDGKYYRPSQEVMHETEGVPKENIISERDFAHLDRQLEQKSTASTVALSVIICFINKKTPKYLDSIT